MEGHFKQDGGECEGIKDATLSVNDLLPRSTTQEGGAALRSMPKNYLSQAKVLIVDDEPSNVRLLERILALSGCTQVKGTTDSRNALGLLLDFDPDIVLLDMNMPHFDGFAIMNQFQAVLDPDVYLPILVLTADITAETKRKALASGAKDFVIKPIDQSEVILRIKNLIENRFLHSRCSGKTPCWSSRSANGPPGSRPPSRN
jgi:PleD family two-component response regulator